MTAYPHTPSTVTSKKNITTADILKGTIMLYDNKEGKKQDYTRVSRGRGGSFPPKHPAYPLEKEKRKRRGEREHTCTMLGILIMHVKAFPLKLMSN